MIPICLKRANGELYSHLFACAVILVACTALWWALDCSWAVFPVFLVTPPGWLFIINAYYSFKYIKYGDDVRFVPWIDDDHGAYFARSSPVFPGERDYKRSLLRTARSARLQARNTVREMCRS